MAMLSPVPGAQVLPPEIAVRATFNGCLNEAARHSGKDDHEIAAECHVCAGYFSRFMRSVGQQQAKRLVAFMRATNSLAPLQWLAEQMGCELSVRDKRAAEVAALKARLKELGDAA